MPQTLSDYIDALSSRADIARPELPPPAGAAANPHCKPIDGVRAVIWNLYGTLLRISDGELLHFHVKPMRLLSIFSQVIAEFELAKAFAPSCDSPPGELMELYRVALEEREMAPVTTPDSFPHVESAAVWEIVFERLAERGFRPLADARHRAAQAQLVSYFFHCLLQTTEAAPRALRTIATLSQAKLVQGLCADTQSYSLLEMHRAFQKQGTTPPIERLFDLSCSVLSHEFGLRKPSRPLYAALAERLSARGIQPGETLFVGTRLAADLAVAREFGFRTVLYVGDKSSLKASVTELNHPDLRPKRLVCELNQVCQIAAGASRPI